jgi:hypothetical protein
VSFAAITICVASQRVLVDVYFVIDSVRKLLDTPSYKCTSRISFAFYVFTYSPYRKRIFMKAAVLNEVCTFNVIYEFYGNI